MTYSKLDKTQYLKVRRAELGLTQSEFARKLDVPMSTYVGYEKGYREMTVKFIESLLKENKALKSSYFFGK